MTSPDTLHVSTNGNGKGASPVSMAKRSMAAGSNSAINFGTPHDQNAASALSSSPAGPAQLNSPHAPTKFGSVEADAKVNKDKVSGISGKGEGGAQAPARSLDLNKLFQGTPQTPVKAPATSTAPNGALSPSVASTPKNGNPVTPSSSSTTSLRGSAATQRPFEPQRNTSQSFHPMNPQSNSWSQQPGQPQQQPRSPHLGHQSNMQPMPPMGGPPHWQGQQMYYSNMYQQPYGYGGMPPQQQQQHAHQIGQPWYPSGYDGGAQGQQPRSPRHMPASPMAGGPHPGTPQQSNGTLQSAAPSTAGGPAMSSPATSQRSIPHTPTTNPSSLSSPQPQGHHHFGLGHPTGRGGYQGSMPSGSFSHTPSHSFGGAMNPMSPSARQFEPAQKRMSSAIKIVNPETHTAIEVKPVRDSSSPAPGTPTPASAANAAAAVTTAAAAASPSPAVKKASALPTNSAAASPAPSNKTASAAVASPAAAKIDTTESFMARVKAAAAESKKAKLEAAAGAEREAAEKKAKEAAEQKAKEAEEERLKKVAADEEAAKKREEEEKAAAEKKAAEEAAAKAEAEKKEKEAKAAAEAQEQAAKEEAAAKAAAAEKARAEEEEQIKKHAEEVAAKQAPPAPIDTSAAVTETKLLDAEEAAVAGSDSSRSPTAPRDVPTTPSFRGSAADVERMAREASSVPSTPLEGSAPRLPATPRTPGTPGFANLPAKPVAMSSMGSNTAGASNAAAAAATATATANTNGMKLDSDALEKRKRPVPSQLDLTAAQPRSASVSSDGVPISAASAALGSARFIEDINKVSYPDKIQSPKPELNESAEPGKFRYDRAFLMQFMGVYKEKPTDLPPLAQIGMDSSMAAAGRGGPVNRRASGMGPPAAPGRAGSHIGLGLGGGFGAGKVGGAQNAPKTSEERFAQSNARVSVGAFGSSGPMGSFNAGARSQPLSRTGSGSNAIPTRDAMGTGVPSGGRTASRRGRERRDPGGRGGHVNPPEKGGPTIPLDQVVPLQASENRWVGGRGAAKPQEGPEMVTRKVKALLNKLTMEKFDSISKQILEWANKSINEKDGQTLRLVIALIFEKATDEAAWSEMYALLCRKILEELDPSIQDENLKTNDNQPVAGGHLFRKYLLNRCQEDFERGWAQRDSTAAAAKSKEAEDAAKKAEIEKAEEAAKDAEARGEKVSTEPKETELLSDEYYEAQKAKRRGLGLVRFIGELFKLSMLTEKIMHICIQRLLSNAQDPEEEEIESLCKLLTTVGKLLKATNHVDVYFQRINETMKNGAMNSRMKFMLQDVIDLRSSGWIPRHDNAAPKTIAQIHEDAARQKAQQEAEAYARQSRGGSMGGPLSRGGSRRGQQRDQYGPDGFITVGNQPQPPVHQTKAGNLSGFGKGFDRSGSARPLSVGPQSVFAKKNQKSDDGSNPPSRTASSQNIFSLLSSTNDGATEAAAGAGAAAGAEDGAGGRPKLNLAKRTKPLPSQDGGEGEDDDKADDDKEEQEEGEESDMSDEKAANKIDNDIKEYLEIKDVEEGVVAMSSLPSSRRSAFVTKIVETVLNKKEDDVTAVGNLFEAAREKGLLDDEMVQIGFKEHMEILDDLAIDVPSAYKFMAILVVSTGLAKEKIEAMADTIQGEGLKPPKDRFMDKVNDELA